MSTVLHASPYPGLTDLGPDGLHEWSRGYLHGGTVVTVADSMCGYGTIVNLPDGAKGFITVELEATRSASDGRPNSHGAWWIADRPSIATRAGVEPRAPGHDARHAAPDGRVGAMSGRGRWLAYGLLVALVATGCSQWTTYHHDPGRSGNDPSAASTILPVAHAWTSPFLDGFVFAQPLVYHNRVYVATEHNTVYALDLATGAVVWTRHLAEPMRATSVVCPLNIDPLGITGTPVIDTASNTIFAVTAELGPPVAHRLYGLDVDTGATRVNVSADPSGTDPTMDNQRPALALANGRVYWAYGGEDCGQYHGKVVSMTTAGTDPLVYVVPTTNRGSIWGPSGPAVDGDGNVWVATGDGTETTNFDHSTSVIKLSPTLQELGFFAPSNWASLNRSGLELGSTGPMMLPGGFVFQVGKSGDAYVINQATPGGIGGQVTSLSLGCGAYGGDAFAGGMIFVPCTNGTRGVALDNGPTLRSVWRGPSDANGSPTFGGNAVWVIGVDSGTLYALNPTTGAVLQSMVAGHARHFTSPTINGDMVLVATDHMVQAFKHTSSP